VPFRHRIYEKMTPITRDIPWGRIIYFWICASSVFAWNHSVKMKRFLRKMYYIFIKNINWRSNSLNIFLRKFMDRNSFQIIACELNVFMVCILCSAFSFVKRHADFIWSSYAVFQVSGFFFTLILLVIFRSYFLFFAQGNKQFSLRTFSIISLNYLFWSGLFPCCEYLSATSAVIYNNDTSVTEHVPQLQRQGIIDFKERHPRCVCQDLR